MVHLRDMRKRRGLTQCGLAKLAGITQTHISDIENGKRDPGLRVLIALARALGCTLDDLVDMEAPPTAS